MSVLTPFRHLIREKCGVTFKNDALHLLESSINKRRAACALSGHDEYLARVHNDAEELHRLIDLITINETYFMREKQHFAVLCDAIMPQMLARGGKIKILSAGCSTGEEAYSILISLVEKYGLGIKSRVEIYGMDIDRNVIKAAREGVYGSNSFRGEEPILLKYFEQRNDKRFALVPAIRDGVVFQTGNLLQQPYPAILQKMDIVFYRNVSIYFDREVQQTIFHNLSGMLNPGGYVFLSSTETYYHNVGILTLKEHDGVFLYHKNTDIDRKYEGVRPRCMTSPSAAFAGMAGKPSQRVVTPEMNAGTEKNTRALFEEALADAAHKKYDQCLEKIETLLRVASPPPEAHALKAGILVNLQKFEAAREECRKILILNEWNLEAHLLLGIVAKIKEEYDEALKMFRAALYINSKNWLAHFYLGEIYFVQHDHAGARREYGITLRLLETEGLDGHCLTHFPLSVTAGQMMHLCQHNIDRLSAL